MNIQPTGRTVYNSVSKKNKKKHRRYETEINILWCVINVYTDPLYKFQGTMSPVFLIHYALNIMAYCQIKNKYKNTPSIRHTGQGCFLLF